MLETAADTIGDTVCRFMEMTVVTPDVIEWRLQQLEEDRKRIADALDLIVRLEHRHEETREGFARTQKIMEDVETRVRAVEAVMPLVKLTSNWVIVGVLGILSLVGMAGYRTISAYTAPAAEIRR
jgi:hypothetical protein